MEITIDLQEQAVAQLCVAEILITAKSRCLKTALGLFPG